MNIKIEITYFCHGGQLNHGLLSGDSASIRLTDLSLSSLLLTRDWVPGLLSVQNVEHLDCYGGFLHLVLDAPSL